MSFIFIITRTHTHYIFDNVYIVQMYILMSNFGFWIHVYLIILLRCCKATLTLISLELKFIPNPISAYCFIMMSVTVGSTTIWQLGKPEPLEYCLMSLISFPITSKDKSHCFCILDISNLSISIHLYTTS